MVRAIAVLVLAAAPSSAQTLSAAYSDLSSRMALARRAQQAAAAAPAARAAQAAEAPAAPAAPDFTLSGPSGTHSLSDYSGKVVVIEFWGAFAAATRVGASARSALAARRAGDGVVMLDVGVGEDGSRGVSALAATASNEVVLYDADRSVFSAYSGYAIPTAVVVDADGRVVATVPGADAGRVDEAVSRALGAR